MRRCAFFPVVFGWGPLFYLHIGNLLQRNLLTGWGMAIKILYILYTFIIQPYNKIKAAFVFKHLTTGGTGKTD